MAYGNYAPFYRGGFFNPMQQPQMPMMAENQAQYAPQYQPQMSQPTNDMMIWVLGQTEAESYPVAPNNSVVLWDKSKPTIYVKSVNAQGVPSMRVLDFKERVDAPSQPQEQPQTHVCKCGDKFVSKADFEELKAKFDELAVKYETLETKGTERAKAKSSKSKESEE